MASLLDQFTRCPTVPLQHQLQNSPAQCTDEPIFKIFKINFTPNSDLTHLSVCNNVVIIATANNQLQRFNLVNSNQKDEIALPHSLDDRIYNLYQHPNGQHVIISMLSGENFYLSFDSVKPKLLNKLKGHRISAIGWNNSYVSETSTGELLIGTRQSLILETEINNVEDARFFQSSLEQYVKQLMKVGKDKEYPITGIHFDKLPSLSPSENNFFVLVTLPGRLYQFLGTVPSSSEPPLFQHIFAKYENIEERFLEVPGNFGYSELQVYKVGGKNTPKRFAWMTGPGVLHGEMDVAGAMMKDSVTCESRLMEYQRDTGERPTSPRALTLTQFHVLILFPDRLKAINLLNEQVVYQKVFTEGKMIGMCKDVVKETIWVFNSQSIWRYKVEREERDVWKIFLEQSKFNDALQYCGDDALACSEIKMKHADHLYHLERYEESAELYAMSDASFEEVTLKFIPVASQLPLKKYLLKKLELLSDKDSDAISMLVVWLVELYLTQLAHLKEDKSDDFESSQSEFRQFLASTRVRHCITQDSKTVYELICSHGDIDNMVFFAVLMQDFERVIMHHVQQGNFQAALQVLDKQLVPQRYVRRSGKHVDYEERLMCKYSPLLMHNIPAETVDMWMSKWHALDPKLLIPAIAHYESNPQMQVEAVRYLEFCVNELENTDQAIHNLLLSLYVKYRPEKVMQYLEKQGDLESEVCYDTKYALRLCSDYKNQRACVLIYSTMGLYEEAVQLALQLDANLAKLHADKPENDEELRKKLWLKIARHVVEEEKDVKRAMRFLQECELLKIEDILPFFPDFVTIDHFKDAICSSLMEYNKDIEALKVEMNEATENAQDIRQEIQSFRSKCTLVGTHDRCSKCSSLLMVDCFYVFPCGHKFHTQCLLDEVSSLLCSHERMELQNLQQQMQTLSRSNNQTGNSPLKSTSYQEKIDEIIAGECVYCGSLMIQSIDKPLTKDEELVNDPSWF